MTDHEPEAPKYLTGSEEEDQDCNEYEQSVAQYNAAAATPVGSRANLKYERGSLMQRILDPYAGAPRDEDGAIVYTVTDEELAGERLDDLEYQ